MNYFAAELSFEALKAGLALAEHARRVSLELGDFDTVELTKNFSKPVVPDLIDIRIDIAIVTFAYSKNGAVVSIRVGQDGSFGIGSSACVYTDHAKDQLAAYARALRFIERYRLEPSL